MHRTFPNVGVASDGGRGEPFVCCCLSPDSHCHGARSSFGSAPVSPPPCVHSLSCASCMFRMSNSPLPLLPWPCPYNPPGALDDCASPLVCVDALGIWMCSRITVTTSSLLWTSWYRVRAQFLLRGSDMGFMFNSRGGGCSFFHCHPLCGANPGFIAHHQCPNDDPDVGGTGHIGVVMGPSIPRGPAVCVHCDT